MGFEKIVREGFVKDITSINWMDEKETEFINGLAKSFRSNYLASYEYARKCDREEEKKEKMIDFYELRKLGFTGPALDGYYQTYRMDKEKLKSF